MKRQSEVQSDWGRTEDSEQKKRSTLRIQNTNDRGLERTTKLQTMETNVEIEVDLTSSRQGKWKNLETEYLGNLIKVRSY